ncbi:MULTISPECIES: rhomboid family intramembrane serine protease [Corynebacterium]|nr:MULTISPECIES: rhomboid family intramembrane serine protease [Corynebacterium]
MTRTFSAVMSSIAFLTVLWIVQIVNVYMGGYLTNFGVHPRDPYGLIGIPLAPFIHGSWEHLIANTSIAWVLVFLVALSGRAVLWRASTIIVLVSGLGTWVVASPLTVHVGASGLIFGWVTFLIFQGWYSRSILQMLLGVVVVFAYGGVLWGVFPTTMGVSWQMHLFGAIGGVIAARSVGQDMRRNRQVMKRRQRMQRAPYQEAPLYGSASPGNRPWGGQ